MDYIAYSLQFELICLNERNAKTKPMLVTMNFHLIFDYAMRFKVNDVSVQRLQTMFADST